MDIGGRGGARKAKPSRCGAARGGGAGGGRCRAHEPPGGGAPRPAPAHALRAGPERSARHPPPPLSCHEPWRAGRPAGSAHRPQRLTSIVLGVGIVPRCPALLSRSAPRPSCGRLRFQRTPGLNAARAGPLHRTAVASVVGRSTHSTDGQMRRLQCPDRLPRLTCSFPSSLSLFEQLPRARSPSPPAARAPMPGKRLSGLQVSFLESGARQGHGAEPACVLGFAAQTPPLAAAAADPHARAATHSHRLLLQRQVLSLYRSALRAARAKEGAGSSLAALARSELEK